MCSTLTINTEYWSSPKPPPLSDLLWPNYFPTSPLYHTRLTLIALYNLYTVSTHFLSTAYFLSAKYPPSIKYLSIIYLLSTLPNICQVSIWYSVICGVSTKYLPSIHRESAQARVSPSWPTPAPCCRCPSPRSGAAASSSC